MSGHEDRTEADRTRRSPGRSPLDERTNFFVGWGTLALINAGLAQGKGRSGLVWCLLSLLLGPVATFLIVVLGRVPADIE